MLETLSPVQLSAFSVDDSDDDDPVLLDAGGLAVDTWREGYPYTERLDRDTYELEKRLLQIELIKLQSWVSSLKSTDLPL